MPDNEVQSERFKVPKSPTKLIYEITDFLGCDFTSSPSAVDASHSPRCVNMIRYMPGKIRKRMGYFTVATGSGAVYSIFKWDNNNYLFHIGKYLYRISRDLTGELDFSAVGGTETTYSVKIKDTSNDPIELQLKKYAFIRSGDSALIFGNGSLYFYEGGDVLYDTTTYDRTDADGTVHEIYVPTVTISKAPGGGGQSYESFNLINAKFCESFYVSANDAGETDFNLSYTDLDSIDAVYVMDSDGEWQLKETPGDYTIDLDDGVVSFTAPPGQSPSEGEDSVRIIASKAFTGYASKIANCSFGIAYGVSGNYDRVFLSGNPDYPSFDWYSGMDDITYFPDTGYSVLGSDASPITAYAIVSNYLVALKGDGTDKQTAIIRKGAVDENGDVVFQVVKSLQGYPVIARDTSCVAGIEPMFLTREGIMAITTSDLSGDQIMNSRSFYLNGQLLKEKDLEKAFAVRHGDYYMLFVNGKVYILDTLQIVAAQGAPYSTRQYASFYWENVPAVCAASIDDKLYFGTADGKVMQFYTDPDSLISYSDNGSAIPCVYETADIDVITFFKVKTYRYIALRVFPSVVSSVNLYALKHGIWELVKADATTIRYFSFSHVCFSKFTFCCDNGLKIVGTKARIKKLDHVRFKFENAEKNEPLMIDQFGIEYTQAGNYKD